MRCTQYSISCCTNARLQVFKPHSGRTAVPGRTGWNAYKDQSQRIGIIEKAQEDDGSVEHGLFGSGISLLNSLSAGFINRHWQSVKA